MPAVDVLSPVGEETANLPSLASSGSSSGIHSLARLLEEEDEEGYANVIPDMATDDIVDAPPLPRFLEPMDNVQRVTPLIQMNHLYTTTQGDPDTRTLNIEYRYGMKSIETVFITLR